MEGAIGCPQHPHALAAKVPVAAVGNRASRLELQQRHNQLLEVSLGAIQPSRVIVVDPCETASFETKAPELFALGRRASREFCHVRRSGDVFLDKLRVDFSRAFIRRVLHAGAAPYFAHAGVAPDQDWLEPSLTNAGTLWRVRRDLEGRNPNEPAKAREPIEEPLLGMRCRSALTGRSTDETGIGRSSHDERNPMLERQPRPAQGFIENALRHPQNPSREAGSCLGAMPLLPGRLPDPGARRYSPHPCPPLLPRSASTAPRF
jgi:hypothetical protein